MISRLILDWRLDLVAFAIVVGFSIGCARILARRRGIVGPPRTRTLAVAALAIVLGAFVAEGIGRISQRQLQRWVMIFAATYGGDLERMGHARIAADTPVGDAGYQAMLATQRAWLRANSFIGALYTCRRMPDGSCLRVTDTMDTTGPGTTVGARPRCNDAGVCGQLAPSDRAHAGEAVFDPAVVQDERGRWVRGFQPIRDEAGKVDAVLVVEVPAETWGLTTLFARLSALATIFAGTMLLVGIAYFSRQQATLVAREQAGRRLRESELRFRSLFENVPSIAVQGYDRDRRVIFWNEASAELYGYTAAEALGQRLEELIIPPPMRSDVVELIRRWAEEDVPIPPGELVLMRKGGAAVNVFSSHVMQRNVSGDLEMYCIDISLADRNRALAALAASEVNYRTLFAVIPHPMWVCDAETGAFLAVNEAALTKYGYWREEFLQMSQSDLGAPLPAPALRPSEAGRPALECWHRKKNGEPLRVELSSHPLAWGGRKARIVLAQDVTERRNAERRIVEQAELLDEINEAVVAVDAGGRINFWNHGAAQLFGRPASEMQGRLLSEVGHVDASVAALADVLRTQHDGWRGEVPTRHADGRAVYLETSITIIAGDSTRPALRVSVSTDITPRKELEAQVIEAQKMEVIGRLAGGVAHDFNSILMAMALNLEMLQSDLRDNQAAQPLLEDLRAMNERATTLVCQLLVFARKHAMKPQPLEVDGAIATVAKILHRLLGAHVTLHAPSASGELWINADPCMFDQVLLNLCVNARDAMPDGGTLTISTQPLQLTADEAAATPGARAGEFVCVQVTDTGCGMSPMVLAHAFEPFFTTKEAGKGTGLGLATVHGIVHQHGGWLTVESEVGQGTTFRVFLPQTTAPRGDAEDDLDADIRRGTETILLVEDDPAVRRVTTAMLLRFGYKVLVSANGPQALEVWSKRSFPIQVLITDVVLPEGMNGLVLARRLTAVAPELKVIVMSGYNVEMMEAGSDGLYGYTFLQKPVNSRTLASAIRAVLD
ncbi:PAS domain-containing sensor histidine kinase [Opitutus sp. ER46]|uniref:hybrid sensor histidine kinase/response regulator n=1 Tax=Opitutus sp. ER46 TaxID=2161864 RepID=UPI001304C8E6|nr:PAS domain-containing sensor histidine kinase [Opitutus sp. ER46]